MQHQAWPTVLDSHQCLRVSHASGCSGHMCVMQYQHLGRSTDSNPQLWEAWGGGREQRGMLLYTKNRKHSREKAQHLDDLVLESSILVAIAHMYTTAVVNNSSLAHHETHTTTTLEGKRLEPPRLPLPPMPATNQILLPSPFLRIAEGNTSYGSCQLQDVSQAMGCKSCPCRPLSGLKTDLSGAPRGLKNPELMA